MHLAFNDFHVIVFYLLLIMILFLTVLFWSLLVIFMANRRQYTHTHIYMGVCVLTDPNIIRADGHWGQLSDSNPKPLI